MASELNILTKDAIEELPEVVEAYCNALPFADDTAGIDETQEFMRDLAATVIEQQREIERLRQTLESIRDGYGPNHLSGFSRDTAIAALRYKLEGGA